MIPFSIAEFLAVFVRYNNAVWPGQVVIYLAGLIAIGLALKRYRDASKAISFILALLWLWMAIVYHWIFFSTINEAARFFGALFVVQALVFVFAGVLNSRLSFKFKFDVSGIVGGVLITYALVLYPILGIIFGHKYPAAPTFGVPCPTTIFTFGILLAAARKVPLYVLLIPFLWSLLGFWAAVSLGMTQDYGLVVAGLITVLWNLLQRREDQSPIRTGLLQSFDKRW